MLVWDPDGDRIERMLGNATRNQHFLPRVEQKLNALNPGSANGEIPDLFVPAGQSGDVRAGAENPRGRPIDGTLSMLDLFSFDVSGGGQLRLNLEELFHKYEVNVEVYTRSLLEKLATRDADIKAEIIDLFAAKLLNFIRNPFCIEKVLNSFPGVASYEPTDPELLATYRKVVTGRKPHQAYLCAELGISDQTYIEWLRLLFILLVHTANDQPNLFEGVIKGLFEGAGHASGGLRLDV